MAKNWDEIYANLDALSETDREEIALKVAIIGEIIEARKKQGLSQAELGAAAGYKQPMIARLENAGMDPQLSTLLRILRPLGLILKVVPLEG